jgi:hypothetical protein
MRILDVAAPGRALTCLGLAVGLTLAACESRVSLSGRECPDRTVAPVGESFELKCNCGRLARRPSGRAEDASNAQTTWCEDDLDMDGNLSLAGKVAACEKMASDLNESEGEYNRAGAHDPILCAFDPDFRGDGDRLEASNVCYSEGTCGVSTSMLSRADPMTTFAGEVDASQSYVRITRSGETATLRLTGEVYLRGGDCAGSACDFTLEHLETVAAPFVLNGATVESLRLANHGFWSGVKAADNQIAFDPATSILGLNARIAGAPQASTGFPLEGVRGRLYEGRSVMPNGVTAHQGYLLLEGRYPVEMATAEVFLVLPFGTGGPRARVSVAFTPCFVDGAPDCGYVFDASGSTDFDGGPIAQTEWFDAQGRLVGNGPRIFQNTVVEVPGSPSRFPLSVQVTDAAGLYTRALAGLAVEPARQASYGWLYANQPAAAARYNAPAAYSFNSGGGTNTVQRTARGLYTIQFPTLGAAAGVVHTSLYGASDGYCKSRGWSNAAGTLTATIACYDRAGALADRAFVASYQNERFVVAGSRAVVAQDAYLWAGSPASAAYDTNPAFSWNPGGRPNRLTRVGAGHYKAAFPGMPVEDLVAVVTPYGAGSERCQVDSIVGDAQGAVVVVRCTTAAGVAANSAFTLTVSHDGPPLGSDALPRPVRGASLETYSPLVTPLVLSPRAYGSDLGGAPTQTRLGVGQYRFTVPTPVAVANDTVQLAARSNVTVNCRITSWSRAAAATTVNVQCMNPAGAATDSKVSLNYLTTLAR